MIHKPACLDSTSTTWKMHKIRTNSRKKLFFKSHKKNPVKSLLSLCFEFYRPCARRHWVQLLAVAQKTCQLVEFVLALTKRILTGNSKTLEFCRNSSKILELTELWSWWKSCQIAAEFVLFWILPGVRKARLPARAQHNKGGSTPIAQFFKKLVNSLSLFWLKKT